MGAFPPPKKKNSRGQKYAKFGPILDDFKLLQRISSERIQIFKIGQVRYWPWFLLRSAKKSQVNFGPVTTQIWRSDCTHLKFFSWKTIFRSYGVLHLQIFTCTVEWPSLGSTFPTGNGVPLTIFFQRVLKIGLKFDIFMPVAVGVKVVSHEPLPHDGQ